MYSNWKRLDIFLTISVATFVFIFIVETCQTLLKRDLRRNLFVLFSTWSGKYGAPVRSSGLEFDQSHKKCSELQLAALQAMSALLCCGPCFDTQGLSEDGPFYNWLDVLLESSEEKVRAHVIYYLYTRTCMYPHRANNLHKLHQLRFFLVS